MNKLVYITTGLGYGGAEKIVIQLANHFCESNKYNVSVVVLTNNVDRISEIVRGVNVIALNLNESISVRKLLKAYRVLRIADIIHAHMYHALLFSFLMLRFDAFYTSHNTKFSFRRKIIMALLRPCRYADILLFPGAKGYWIKKKTFVIPNAVEMKSKINEVREVSQNGTIKFLFCGSMTRQKDPVGLLKIMISEVWNYPVELTLLGDGPLMGDVRKMVLNNNQKNLTIKIVGNSNKVYDYMLKSDLLLLYSDWEGLPMVALEAGMLGLPVLATDVGGLPWLLSGDRGVCCPKHLFRDNLLRFNREGQWRDRATALSSFIEKNLNIRQFFILNEQLYSLKA